MKVLKLITSIIISFTAGAIGSFVTLPAIPTWYAELDKPFFSPPNWVFGPVWTILYLLMAIALWKIWIMPTKQNKKPAYIAFGVQLALNIAWSLVFFGLQLPWAAVLVIVALIAAIVVTIRLFWAQSRLAAYLLMPYLLWVLFATALNTGVAFLN